VKRTVVILTGAAGGIGAATAELLADRGVDVLGIDMVEPSTCSNLADFALCDLADLAAAKACIDRFKRFRSRLDGLVNNAVWATTGPFLDATLDELDMSYALNMRGLFSVSQQVCRIMVEQGDGGSVVHLASVNALCGVADTSIYSMMKGALVALTRTMAVELAAFGIRCNSVAPASTETRLLLSSLSREEIEQRRSRIPLGRLGSPLDVAEAICFLLSPSSAFITGVTLPVDGGYVAGGTWSQP
jgi:NAD(P)-dependent dehydrogenase (short-subunit alcohol dehydrogenase family)